MALPHPRPARDVLQVLNEQYSGQLRRLLGQPDREADDAVFISVDKLGADIRVRKGGDYLVERVGFDKVSG